MIIFYEFLKHDLVSNNGASAANVLRSSEQEVYNYILADLLDAQGNKADSDVYHFSNDALNVLLAKVYMNQEDYENATTILESVVGEYSLVGDYSSVFSNGSNSEAIFRVNYSTDDQNSLAFYFYLSGLGGRREVVPSF
ncbi:hypothetical protein [Zunongwangia sp. HRR-M8]|uniref:hypothetical protein n=1 Tax=Zunongwangia sp. HRR-M8 TaxID=3015170 RepID=UPI0022DE6592|nr:hypothetical protein [Zunongwangia sp. HRR-M8]WBL21925.1 hypothetical protein PBT89_14555 [Zunongwangia sp. HRR-M8]